MAASTWLLHWQSAAPFRVSCLRRGSSSGAAALRTVKERIRHQHVVINDWQLAALRAWLNREHTAAGLRGMTPFVQLHTRVHRGAHL